MPCSFVGQQDAGDGPVPGYRELQSPMLRPIRSHLGILLAIFEPDRGMRIVLWIALIGRSAPTRPRTQLQVLAMLGSMPGISYPSHVQSAINIAKLANLDLVRCVTDAHVEL
jgi:hypothetical protein